MTAPTNPTDGDLFMVEPGVWQRFDQTSASWRTVQAKSPQATAVQLFHEGVLADLANSGVPVHQPPPPPAIGPGPHGP